MKGWRTILVQIIAAMLTGAGGLGFYDLSVPADAASAAVVDAVTNANTTIQTLNWSGFGWALLNAALRFITTTPVGKA